MTSHSFAQTLKGIFKDISVVQFGSIFDSVLIYVFIYLFIYYLVFIKRFEMFIKLKK